MKSVFGNRGKLLIGLFAMVFSNALIADTLLEPTWVKEGVNWAQYSKFRVNPLDIDDVNVIKPPYAAGDTSDWTLEVKDLEGMQAIFRDVMKDGLENNGGYSVVHHDAKDVLEVRVEIINIMPWLKPGGGDEFEGFEVQTLGSGEITARIELRDSLTQDLLLLIEGDKEVGEQYKQFNRENNISNVTFMFTQFANHLRAAMDRVHGK